jgi:bifunctional N-acetylglucosamine-1-phosphate-uridyltransferase/glucosamine-1-phosphate-acetyltransferase GlmU-like protein
VIRKDLPEGALGVSQGEQRNIEGYAKRKRAKHDDAEGGEE